MKYNFEKSPFSLVACANLRRFEEISEKATSCKDGEKCIGGYARAVTVIKELKRSLPNPIYLNAGDNFQGTLWYSFGRWNVTSQFLNMLKADAIVSFNLKTLICDELIIQKIYFFRH